jgi:hypothetical protein
MSSQVRLAAGVGLVAMATLLSRAPLRATNNVSCSDFFGTTGRASFAYLEASAGALQWTAMNNGGPGLFQLTFGTTADFPVHGCYDANPVADVAVWRGSPAPAVFYYRNSQTGSLGTLPFGVGATDVPMGGDFDGDGRRDFTLVRNNGTAYDWYWIESGDGSFHALTWGSTNSMIPLPPADYNGDGRDDVTVLALNTSFNGPGTYWAADAHTGATVIAPRQFGLFDTDFYITGDFIGDSRADFAVWRAGRATPANGVWYILENGGAQSLRAVQFGGYTGPSMTRDRPLRADYNGDGKADIAVQRPTDGTWYWLDSPGFTTFHAQPFGPVGQTPFPLAHYGVQ